MNRHLTSKAHLLTWAASLMLFATPAFSTDLLNAVESGDLGDIESALSNQPESINHVDPDRGTALHIAANTGNLNALDLLLQHGADTTVLIGKGQKSALHIAAQGGHIEAVKKLLEQGADGEIRDKKGETPIFSAILKNRFQVVDLLLDSGANIEAVSRFKDTPLSKSISLGRTELTERLLAKGAKLNLEKVAKDKCSKCHGMDGRSGAPFSANLAAMGERYLIKQFKDYQSGSRSHPKMNSKLTGSISDTVLTRLSGYYAAKPPIKLVSDPESASRGKTLYESVPSNEQSCATCHSDSGVASGPDDSRLANQNAEYLAIQLRSYRDGTRDNDPGNVMRSAAQALSDDEISDIASYLQGL